MLGALFNEVMGYNFMKLHFTKKISEVKALQVEVFASAALTSLRDEHFFFPFSIKEKIFKFSKEEWKLSKRWRQS